MYVEIELTQGRVALVDECDAPAVKAKGKWRYANGYAVRSVRNADGTRTTLYMHRFITGDLVGDDVENCEVDHRDGDGVNNTRLNLRVASNSLNQMNRPSAAGVTFDKQSGKWRPYVSIDGKFKRLGRFATREEALAVRRAAIAEHYGEFAPSEFVERDRVGLTGVYHRGDGFRAERKKNAEVIYRKFSMDLDKCANDFIAWLIDNGEPLPAETWDFMSRRLWPGLREPLPAGRADGRTASARKGRRRLISAVPSRN